MKKIKDLTAVILTKDEEKNLPRCLKSLAFAAKILVVDDCSTDQTVTIGKKFDAQILERKLDDFSAQRNFALSKVETEWVLFVDADEEVSFELTKEIREAVGRKDIDGYQIPRKNLIFGRWIKHSGWYPDWQLHLFRAKKGKYLEKVHEQAQVKGKIGFLKNDLLHYNYQTISHFLSPLKFDLYASLEADQLIESDYQFKWPDLIGKPVDEFLRRFFAENGYQDGVFGLLLALLQAFKEFVIYAKVWEKEGKKEIEITPTGLIFGFGKSLKIKVKEVNHWLGEARLKREKNIFKKMWWRLKRKINL